MIQAQKFKKRLSVDRPMPSQNETGEEIIGWHHVGDISAHIEPLSGREALLMNVNLAVEDTRIRVRWSPGLDQMTEKWRLRRRTHYYDIKSIAHIELDQREIEILAKSGTNTG